jgi:hypothetical protein
MIVALGTKGMEVPEFGIGFEAEWQEGEGQETSPGQVDKKTNAVQNVYPVHGEWRTYLLSSPHLQPPRPYHHPS